MTQIKPIQMRLEQLCKVIDSPVDNDETYSLPHRHDYWEIIWCLDDIGQQNIDFVEYPHKVGRFFTIAPGQVHKPSPSSHNVRLLAFSVGFIDVSMRTTSFVKHLFSSQDLSSPYLDCDLEGHKYLLQLFNLMKEEYLKQPCDWALLESLTSSFLRYLLRFSHRDESPMEERDPRINQVIDLIEQYYKKQKNCLFYADKLCITNKRLNEIVHLALGKTVTQLIHDRIILEANRDLAFSRKTIKTIAHDLGFSDTAYFSRFFRKNMNTSPTQFRSRR
ncbi:helix-turn-helix domain-containing protein [Vibrio ostreicida]|uniref:Helix-turn-helix domain-containing protein n=1 Tax=Vibrio ostreicida TaxID=526588 RepID=A0ABT8BVK6_9VIBR|nr:helix-turn-helix domain-containing protein [Vibrio ostreicida]MDN3610474.1 helix-turn-helix domain-containing protein [Vibrio ostreicida]